MTIEQVNNCLNEADLDDDGFVTDVELEKFWAADLDKDGFITVVELEKHKKVVVVSASSSSSSSASSSASTAAEAQYSTPVAKVLPETGGASLLALGAGALLVAGGLVARRLVR